MRIHKRRLKSRCSIAAFNIISLKEILTGFCLGSVLWAYFPRNFSIKINFGWNLTKEEKIKKWKGLGWAVYHTFRFSCYRRVSLACWLQYSDVQSASRLWGSFVSFQLIVLSCDTATFSSPWKYSNVKCENLMGFVQPAGPTLNKAIKVDPLLWAQVSFYLFIYLIFLGKRLLYFFRMKVVRTRISDLDDVRHPGKCKEKI